MDRRRFLVALALSILAAPGVARAQQPVKVTRIGLVVGWSQAAAQPYWDEFRKGLTALGYKVGQDVILEYRMADGKFERLPELVADLVRSEVNLLVVAGTASGMAAKKATSTIPVVMVHVGDPVRSGLIASLARPGGNLTGLSTLTRDLSAKRLELLKQLLPQLSRIALVLNPEGPLSLLQRRETEEASRQLGLQLQILEVRSSTDYDSAFNTASRQRVGALVVLEDIVSISNRTLIAELAARHRLPAIFATREYVVQGGLMSYGPDLAEHYRRAAVFVDKILKGVKPADLPVEEPRKLELVINLRTAKALGLTIPPSLLLRADQVIE